MPPMLRLNVPASGEGELQSIDQWFVRTCQEVYESSPLIVRIAVLSIILRSLA